MSRCPCESQECKKSKYQPPPQWGGSVVDQPLLSHLPSRLCHHPRPVTGTTAEKTASSAPTGDFDVSFAESDCGGAGSTWYDR